MRSNGENINQIYLRATIRQFRVPRLRKMSARSREMHRRATPNIYLARALRTTDDRTATL